MEASVRLAKMGERAAVTMCKVKRDQFYDPLQLSERKCLDFPASDGHYSDFILVH